MFMNSGNEIVQMDIRKQLLVTFLGTDGEGPIYSDLTFLPNWAAVLTRRRKGVMYLFNSL
jgi:hypothetical protein